MIESGQAPVTSRSAAAQTTSLRRSRRLMARVPVFSPTGGVESRRADEQDHGGVPLFRKSCVIVSWTFVKQVGQ